MLYMYLTKAFIEKLCKQAPVISIFSSISSFHVCLIMSKACKMLSNKVKHIRLITYNIMSIQIMNVMINPKVYYIMFTTFALLNLVILQKQFSMTPLYPPPKRPASSLEMAEKTL